MSTKNFESQMRYLAQNFRLVSLHEIAEWLRGRVEIESPSIAVTLDDGLRGVYDHAFPLLQRYAIPATIFVVENFLRLGQKWNGNATLSIEQIRTLYRSGILVGSHGRSHISLGSAAARAEVLTEIKDSKTGLETLLGMPIRYFAYPYGTGKDVSGEAAAIVETAGYELGLTSIHGCVDRNARHSLLSRVKIERTDSFDTFAEIVRGGMDKWALVDKYGGWLQNPRKD